jgi:hypothetical protein
MERDFVLDIRASRAAIVLCLGDAQILDTLVPSPGTASFRIAADERWLVGPAHMAPEMLASATTQLQAARSAALAVEMTDGWAVCTISGPDVEEVWARLSENRLPPTRPAFIQGAVASVPAKAIVQDGCIHVFTPAPLGHHLPQRILEASADLMPRVIGDEEFALDSAATSRDSAPSVTMPTRVNA